MDIYIYEVDDTQLSVGEQIRLPRPVSALACNFNPNLHSEYLKVPYYLYKISIFHFSKDDALYFLIPIGWTNREAVIYQFNK